MYNKQTEFNKNIKPILQQLSTACFLAHIPYFFAAAVADDGNKTTYKCDCTMPQSADVTLSDNKLISCSHVMNGAVVITSDSIDELDVSELFEPTDTTDESISSESTDYE
ncbi:MAG: hypothetical protein IJ341_01785 [Bacteroidales bacterium]|nr:hypothetical protein [Bacteroidales bacterium]